MGHSKTMWENSIPTLPSERTELKKELDWICLLIDKDLHESSLDSTLTEFFDSMGESRRQPASFTDINLPNPIK